MRQRYAYMLQINELTYCFLPFSSLLKLLISTVDKSTRGKKLMKESDCNATRGILVEHR